MLELSKSDWGQIIEFLGLMIDLTLAPDNPPLVYLSLQKRGELEARILEVLSTKRAFSAALQKLVGELSLAQTATVG